jgi:methanogenic corrinoid protein MtbC1
LAHLYDQAPHVARNGKKVVVACVEGELHDFPARLLADALDLAGFDTLYLGANVPIEGLVQLVQREQPDLLALSVTMAFNISSLRSTVAALRGTPQLSALPIAVGGGALIWASDLASELQAALSASNAQELVDGARRRRGVRP